MKWSEVIRELRGYLNSAEGIPPRTYTAIKLAADVLEFIDSWIRCRDHQGAADEK